MLGERIKKLGAENHELRMLAQDLHKEHDRALMTITGLTSEAASLKSQWSADEATHLEQLCVFQTTIAGLTKDKSRLMEDAGQREAVIGELQRAKADSEAKALRLARELCELQHIQKVLEALRQDNAALHQELQSFREQIVKGEKESHVRRSSRTAGGSAESPPKPSQSPSRPRESRSPLEDEVIRLQAGTNTLSQELFVAQGKVDWLERDKRDAEHRHQQLLSAANEKVQFFKLQLAELVQQLEDKDRENQTLK